MQQKAKIFGIKEAGVCLAKKLQQEESVNLQVKKQ